MERALGARAPEVCWVVLFLAGLAACDGAKEKRADLAEAVVEEGMVLVVGGQVTLGSKTVRVADFLLDEHEVTNEEFARFVEETGHVTDAEEAGGSVVPTRSVSSPLAFRKGVSWREPEGSGSDLQYRESHPVRHVSWHDAAAFARWRGKRLPTLAEWRLAAGARAGDVPEDSPSTGSAGAGFNGWQGRFPVEDLGIDGYAGTAPVGAFGANDREVFDLVGNVREWTSNILEQGAGPGDRAAAVVGGGFLSPNDEGPGTFTPGVPRWLAPSETMSDIGFRCARNANAR